MLLVLSAESKVMISLLPELLLPPSEVAKVPFSIQAGSANNEIASRAIFSRLGERKRRPLKFKIRPTKGSTEILPLVIMITDYHTILLKF